MGSSMKRILCVPPSIPLIDHAATLLDEAEKEIAELKQSLDEANEKNVFLKAELKQLANFNPDWDRLQATQEALGNHMQLLNEANAYIEEALPIKHYLPKISREMYDALGETSLMAYDIEDNKPIWTQDAVDFIAYLPKQSLSKLKADAVREAANYVYNRFNKWGKAQIILNQLADKLEKEVE